MYQQENASFVKEYDIKMRPKRNVVPSRTRAFTIRLCILLFFCALGAALAGTIFFGSFGNRLEPLDFNISSSSPLRLGELMHYEFTIANKGDSTLSDISLNIEFPEGFHYEDATSESSNADHTYWKIGNITKKRTENVRIQGRFSGSVHDEKKLRAQLHYRIGERGTEFITKKEFSSVIQEPALLLELRGPSLVQPGKDTEFKIHFGDFQPESEGSASVIRIITPKQFSYSASPPPDGNQWLMESLKDKADPATHQGDIDVRGIFDKAASGEYDITVQYGLIKKDTFVVIQEERSRVRVASNPLKITVLMNNDPIMRPVSFGSAVPLRIHYENSDTADMNDVSLTLTSESEALDWSEAQNISLGKVNGSSITWTKNERTELERVKPGQSGDIDCIFKIKESILMKGSTDASIVFTLTAAMSVMAGTELQETANDPLTITLPLNANVRIFSSIKKGDSPTHYTVSYDIENDFHELGAITVTVPLGKDAHIVGIPNRSAGVISYNNDSHAIVWTLNKLPVSVKALHASFSLALDPIEGTQENTIAVEAATFSATDAATHSIISLSADSLSMQDAAEKH